MNRFDRIVASQVDRQRGTTLILALVLLLLATLLGLFAMNVGIFAQRSSAADLRSRVMHETLEAALAQGIEYVRNNRKAVITNALTHRCDASDTAFPCGAVPMCAAGYAPTSGTVCTDTTRTRRANMYYYISTAPVDVNGDGEAADNLDKRSLPIGTEQIATAGNGFTVNYGVGAVMCAIANPPASSATPPPTQCTTNSANMQGTYLFTVTAVGNITGDSATGTSANATLTTTFGEAPIAAGAGNPATLVASGTVDINGNGTFVTNPNGAGPGLPLTVWSPSCENTGGAGTVDSCYLEDWMRTANGYNAGGTYDFALNSDGSTKSSIVQCSGNGNKKCTCSNTLSAGQGSLTEGSDVLTNDNRGSCTGTAPTVCTSGSNCKVNYDVDESEFPCDLFQYIFKTQAAEDNAVQSPGSANTLCTQQGSGVTLINGGDCFCEKKKSTTYTVANGSSPTMGVDEAYLYHYALYIRDDKDVSGGIRDGWAGSKLVASCALLASSAKTTGGLIWDRTGGCLGSVSQTGYPDFPVILVSDGQADLGTSTMFGLLFVRDTTAGGSTISAYGGTATYTAHSTGTIYGSVVVQGTAKVNGSSSIVYNGTLMQTLLNLDSNYGASPVPGSWTDRYAY